MDPSRIDAPRALFLIYQETGEKKQADSSGKTVEPHSRGQHYFFRYTLSPIFSSRFGTVTFPSVEAMMMVLPVEEGPNSFERSTLIVNTDPSILISTFFMIVPFQSRKWWLVGSQQRSLKAYSRVGL